METPLISTHILLSGRHLNQGQALISQSRNYFAVLQEDGNFVLYVSPHFSGKNALFSTGTHKNGSKGGKGPFHLVLQKDHNLVLYDSEEENRALWASGTKGRGKGECKLIMQDDGNLVLYDKDEAAIWSSDTCRR